MNKYRLYINDISALFTAENIVEAWDKAVDYCYRNDHNVINLILDDLQIEGWEIYEKA